MVVTLRDNLSLLQEEKLDCSLCSYRDIMYILFRVHGVKLLL